MFGLSSWKLRAVGFVLLLVGVALAVLLLALPLFAAEDPSTFDQRFAVVATDSSGWGGAIQPYQGPRFFEPLRTAWWYNYWHTLNSTSFPDMTLFFPGYQRLYMFWQCSATDTDAQIQQWASAAKAADPNHTIWWAMNNEPNDRGQSNTPAASFAPLYLKYHKNLRLGDPTCKIMGPGLLDWQFTNTSCYQTGKAWYEEFRNTWAANPECVAYSQGVNGTDYPPQDAFCIHSYDLRRPADWHWCRDDMAACHNDLQTYPETRGLKIWNTEYGDLTALTATQAADMMSGLTLWMREQPWMERWFLFYTHDDRYSGFYRLNLFDDAGNITQLGKAYRDTSLLSANESFYNYPFHATYDQAADYVRPGLSKATTVSETLNAPGVVWSLVNGAAYSANTMRGRQFVATTGCIYKIRFSYLTDYDNTKCVLAMDTPRESAKWLSDVSGSSSDYVEVDMNDDPASAVSFGLCMKSGFSYSTPTTGDWRAIISNVTLLTCPNAPVVSDMGVYTNGSISAAWTAPTGGVQPIVGYRYAVGTSPKGTDVLGWTDAGAATSFVRDDLDLADRTDYFVSVRAKDSNGHWGAIGVSAPIRKVHVVDGATSAKDLPDGIRVSIPEVEVSAVNAYTFAVQSQDRSSGIVVVGTPNVHVGDRCTVVGDLATLDGSRRLVNPVVSGISTGETPRPLGVTNLGLGGGESGLQSGVVNDASAGKNAAGLSNTGLLVRVCGRVTSKGTGANSGLFYLDDGSGLDDGTTWNGLPNVGVRVVRTGPVAVGDYEAVTGISNTFTNGATVCRQISCNDAESVLYSQVNFVPSASASMVRAQRFRASAATVGALRPTARIAAVGFNVSTVAGESSTFNLALYNWAGSYSATIAGTPIAARTGIVQSGLATNWQMIALPVPVPADADYLLVMTHTAFTGSIGVGLSRDYPGPWSQGGLQEAYQAGTFRSDRQFNVKLVY